MKITNLTHLRYFYDAVLKKNLAAAAAIHRVSQSAISQAISRLERDLEVDLLVHSKNHFQLTNEGIALSERCEHIFNQIEETEQSVLRKKQQPGGVLTIGASASLSESLLAPLISQCRKKYPAITFHIKIGTTAAIRSMLNDKSISIGFCLDDGSLTAFDKHVLREGSFVLASSKNVDVGATSDPFLLTENRDDVLALRKQFQKRFKKILSESIVAESWSTLAALAKQQVGIGFMPDFLAEKNQLKVCDTPWLNVGYKAVVAYRNELLLARNAKLFIELLA